MAGVATARFDEDMRARRATTVGIPARLREVLAETCSLVAPRECPCGREGTRLCPACAALLARPAVRVESCCDALQELAAARVREEGPALPAGVDHAPLLPVLALGQYAGDLQRLILAWKNGGMLHLGERIGPALAEPVTTVGAGAGARRPLLVPVPSRLGARLRRGEDHVAELVRVIAATGAGRPLLLRAAPTTAQEGRGARQRRRRRIHLAAPGPAAGVPTRPVVIVDDVVTTGSTLRGMHEALVGAGMEVAGAVVVASARLPAPSAVAAPAGSRDADGRNDRNRRSP